MAIRDTKRENIIFFLRWNEYERDRRGNIRSIVIAIVEYERMVGDVSNSLGQAYSRKRLVH
jgi:hypothetical protein